MLSRCANSQCSKRFLRLREGKLFQVEAGAMGRPSGSHLNWDSPEKRRPPRVERYWLCDDCSKLWTLVYDVRQGILLVPAPRPVEREVAAAQAQSAGAD